MSESKLRSAVQNWTSAQRLASENRLFAILDAHFRKFILITVGAEQVYLRFYDPRVLTKYLQRAPADKLIEFFGPCRFLGGAGSNPDELNWFWLNNGETLATEKKDS